MSLEIGRAGLGATRAGRASEVVSRFIHHGHQSFTGVPCSLLSGVFGILEGSRCPSAAKYYRAVREDCAVGMATGLTLAGERSVVLMQNSGLGYCLNTVTSLTLLYKIPVALVISWRGHDDSDAVEHTIIGRALPVLLEAVGLAFTSFDVSDPKASVDRLVALMVRTRGPAALIVADEI